jgi:hypothetical protein
MWFYRDEGEIMQLPIEVLDIKYKYKNDKESYRYIHIFRTVRDSENLVEKFKQNKELEFFSYTKINAILVHSVWYFIFAVLWNKIFKKL